MTPVGYLGAVVAVSTSSAGALIAQAATEGGTVVTVTSAGATASAVAALIYIARLMATGQLVAKSTHDDTKRLTELAVTVAETNRALAALAKDGRHRENELWDFIRDGKVPQHRPVVIDDDH